MIQDIAPHKYYVDYQPSVPNDTDLVLIYGHHTILCNFEDPEICYPSIAEIAAVFPEIKEKAKFLFRIDETDYYELRSPQLPEFGIWKYENTLILRSAVPGFYFMLGLPTETEADMRAIAELANETAARYYDTVPKEKRNGRCQITISTSFFVPKPFTPFQWARMYPPEDYIGRAKVVNDTVKEQLNKKSIKYNWHEADVTVLEGVLARGDRKIGQAILKVYEKGGIFDAWSEYFDYQRWLDAFAECGIDPDFYTMRERSMDEIFPWDFIDTGVTKEFLKREWNNAMKETVTPNCRMRCSGCGVKKFGGGVCYEN